jgi:hypothetical protein
MSRTTASLSSTVRWLGRRVRLGRSLLVAGILAAVVVLAAISTVGGCGKGTRRERWLRPDLAAHPARCTLAYWRKPRFSSGMHGNDATYTDFWRALYRAGDDVVLVGHDHDYERFAPRAPAAGPTRPEGSASSSSARVARPTTASTPSGRTVRSVDIGEQVAFLVTGQFQEFTDASHPEIEHPSCSSAARPRPEEVRLSRQPGGRLRMAAGRR